MVRAFALLSLAGCTILNAPDESRIHKVEICDNGIDDEGDEHTDCGDPDCLSEHDCLLDMPLDRDPPCDPLLPSFTLNDSFDQDELNVERWEPLTGPAIRDDGLELFSAGVRSREEMFIGASIPFQLVLSASILDGVRDDGAGCGFSVAFDAAENVEVPLLEVSTTYVRRGGTTRFAAAELTARCTYRDVPLQPPAAGTLVRAVDRPFELSAIRDPSTRELVVQLDGREICRTAMDETEKAVRLRVSAQNRELTPCGLRVEALDLSIRTQEPPEACEGLRRPLIPDDQCIAGPPGDVRPWEGRVARSREGWEMLMSGDAPTPSGGLTTRLFYRASSLDGRRRWMVEVDPIFSSSFDLLQAGAFLYDAERERLMFWFTDSGPAIYRDRDMDGMDDDWELANGIDPTRDDAGGDADGDGISNALEFVARGPVERGRMMIGSTSAGLAAVPELLLLDTSTTSRIVRTPLAAAPHARGLIGFFGALAPDDSGAIYAGFSSDGRSWQIEEVPVLSRTPGVVEWDASGVRSPAVVFTGDFYLMAYAATGFLGKQAIGLALSRDGIEWTRHANNPVVTGDDVGFDDEGIEPRSIELDGDVIRIWYFAKTNAPNPCLRPRNDYKQIGLTELRGRAR
jgi:hypothetical protein